MEENIYMLADSDICRRIGKKIRSLRLRQNLTQMFLAEQAEISVSTLKRIEEGDIRSFDALMRVIRTLGQLDVFIPLVEEDKMSPNEYYEFVNKLKKKQRRRASSKKKVDSSSNNAVSEW